MPTLSERYYTGREVQRKLGITEPALRNLVNQRRLRKITPPGRKTGVYLREEVDTYAEKWFAFLTAEEPPKTIFQVAKIEDMDGEYNLAYRALGRTMSAELRREWLKKNPESDFVVKHNGKVVGFFRLLPVKHDRLMQFMAGEIRGWDISAEDVEPFEPGKPVECIIMGTAGEPDVDETTRKHYVAILLRGVLRKLEEFGRRGIIITKVYATSQTPSGVAMGLHAGMEQFGPKVGKRLTFVADIEQSDIFLFDTYKRGLAEWKRQSKTNAGSVKESK